MSVQFKHNLYIWLVCTALVTYGFFGSLGHLFAVLLVVAILVLDWRRIWRNKAPKDAVMLYLGLSAVFYILLVRSIPSTSWEDLVFAVSPILPIAFVGLSILLSAKIDFRISPKEVSTCACVGILAVYGVFYILDALPSGHEIKSLGMRSGARISLFTGNPIPFSTIVGGLSLLAVLGWHDRSVTGRVISILCAVIGVYAATIWAGSRGATLGFMLASPFIVLHVTQSKKWTYAFIGGLAVILTALVVAQMNGLVNSSLLSRIIRGTQTIASHENIDRSNYFRMNMWVASIKAIGDAPLLGYGISERFWAIHPHLPEGLNFKFSHSHNDIFGSGVSGGLLGLLAALVSFFVMPLYVMYFRETSVDRRFLAFSITPFILVIASSNTVYFNDAACSFYAFSVVLFYLVKRSTALGQVD